MGRFLMYFVITSLAVFVVCAYALFDHGGGSIAANINDFGVQALTAAGPVQDGSRVVVTGELAYDQQSGDYSITEGDDAVTIRDYEGDALLPDLVGAQVRVSGTYEQDDRSIAAESVIAPSASPAQ